MTNYRLTNRKKNHIQTPAGLLKGGHHEIKKIIIDSMIRSLNFFGDFWPHLCFTDVTTLAVVFLYGTPKGKVMLKAWTWHYHSVISLAW